MTEIGPTNNSAAASLERYNIRHPRKPSLGNAVKKVVTEELTAHKAFMTNPSRVLAQRKSEAEMLDFPVRAVRKVLGQKQSLGVKRALKPIRDIQADLLTRAREQVRKK